MAEKHHHLLQLYFPLMDFAHEPMTFHAAQTRPLTPAVCEDASRVESASKI